MNKILLPLVFTAFIFTAPGFAQNPPAAEPTAPAAPAAAPAVTVKPAHHEHHPELHKAIRKLHAAKTDLEKAADDYGGHKAKAIEAIDHALAELHEAINFSNTK